MFQNQVQLTVDLFHRTVVVAVLVLMAAQITHNLHSVDFWSPSRASMANKPLVNHPLPPQATHTHSPLTASPQPHSSSRSALHCGGGLRVVAVPSVLTHCQMRRSVRTAQRTLGIAPRGGALATLWGTCTDATELILPCDSRDML